MRPCVSSGPVRTVADGLMDCPVCGSGAVERFATARDKEYFTTDEEYTYVRCTACTAVYVDSPPVDRLDVIYPPNYYSYADLESAPHLTDRVKEWLDARMMRKLLDRIPGDALRVLDVGGGTGWSLTHARRVCSRVVETHEVDMDASAAPFAEKAGHVYHCTPVEQFTSPVRFDLIMMLSVIEHVPDPGRVLARMSELLSDRGVLLVKTPNTATLDCRLFRHRNWGGYHCPRHFVLFTRDGLAELAGRCGLRVVDSHYTQGAPQWAVSVIGRLHDRGWIRLGPDRPAHEHPSYVPLTALFAAFDFVRAPFAPTAQMIMTFSRATP